MVMEKQEPDMELASERIPVPQVQIPTEIINVENTNKGSSIPRIKPRLRKKALHAAILRQMEFYFSDANLSKDRFLGNLIQEDPYVDISIFTRFNKIRELTTDINRIAKAIQTSSILSVSQDGTKVYRVTPISVKHNTDDCTVYVQNLPPDADHEWLSLIFAEYGVIEYVSIPRYKSNKKIKGFAFVEYQTPDGAQKCIKSFQRKGCVLPSHTTPDELLSITTFDDAEKDVTLKGKLFKVDPTRTNENVEGNDRLKEENVNVHLNKCHEEITRKDTLDLSTECETSSIENKSKKKREYKEVDYCETQTEDLSKIDDNVTVCPKNKKKKLKHSKNIQNQQHIIESEQTDDKFDTPGVEKQNLDNLLPQSHIQEEVQFAAETDREEGNQSVEVDDVETNNGIDQNKDLSTSDKKKKRKRKRRSQVDDINSNLGLQIMAKKDWKHLRNKYLELQKSKMKQLKQHLRKKRWITHDKNKYVKDEVDDKDKTLNIENVTIRNFKFTPGVIVKIELNDSCTNPSSLKAELKSISNVQYIDVVEGSYQAYVRCDTADSAECFVQRMSKDKCMTILQGEEEQMYWKKIIHDRQEKCGNKVRVKQRGRDKLLKKAEKELGKHIKFDED